ncbi:MAG: calcium/sodium antiporter [Clostridia bacterium]|nr:calcium/sodium antiporter [Clostridia bacterium]
MEYLWLIAGFILLIIGADIFVEGSSALAKSFKIPTIIIGLTVVAFGTSMPEASVSISAALGGQNDIAVSNVIGSNILNLLVVLGASALICPVKSNDTAVKHEIPFSIILTAIFGAIVAFGINLPEDMTGIEAILSADFKIGLVGGMILLLFIAFYVYRQIRGAVKSIKNGEIEEEEEEQKKSLSMSLKMIVLGLFAIVMGGNYVVDNACIIAENFGMSEHFIGLTIIAIGTSLPELVTSVVAARKGESDIALGNVIGSNIFNIAFVLGASAVISPLTVNIVSVYDILILLVVSALSLYFARTQRRFSRIEGILMLGMYALYCGYIFVR